MRKLNGACEVHGILLSSTNCSVLVTVMIIIVVFSVFNVTILKPGTL